MTLDELETVLGHTFSDQTILLEALTHRTWLKERQDRGLDLDLNDQQRLEFLGDAFLGYEVGLHLFDQFPEASEGELTARRRSLVKGQNIHRVGCHLGVLELVRVGEGERARLDRNKKVVEDTVEALIGAILIDASETEARGTVHRLFLTDVVDEVREKDPISAYNDRWQRRFRRSPPEPSYSSSGPDEEPTWLAKVPLPDGGAVSGKGSSQQDARRVAWQ